MKLQITHGNTGQLVTTGECLDLTDKGAVLAVRQPARKPKSLITIPWEQIKDSRFLEEVPA